MFDLNTKFEYLIIYKYEGTIETWTMSEDRLKINLPQMKKIKIARYWEFIKNFLAMIY